MYLSLSLSVSVSLDFTYARSRKHQPNPEFVYLFIQNYIIIIFQFMNYVIYTISINGANNGFISHGNNNNRMKPIVDGEWPLIINNNGISLS